MVHSNIMDKLHNHYGFSYACAAKKADLTAFFKSPSYNIFGKRIL